MQLTFANFFPHTHIMYRYFMLFTLSVLQVHYLLANLLQLHKIFVSRMNHYLSLTIKLDPSHSLSLPLFI